MRTRTLGTRGTFDCLRHVSVLSPTQVCSHKFWGMGQNDCPRRTCIGCGRAWCVERIPLLLGPCCIVEGIR